MACIYIIKTIWNNYKVYPQIFGCHGNVDNHSEILFLVVSTFSAIFGAFNTEIPHNTRVNTKLQVYVKIKNLDL